MRAIDADALIEYLRKEDDDMTFTPESFVRVVQDAPTVTNDNQNQTYSVHITESENCLRDWMEQSIPAISLHGMTLAEATMLLQICARQKEPHDAVMKIETAD